MSMFFSSRKTCFKSWLDTSSILGYLLSFLCFFLSQSQPFLDSWWIDREISYLLDSSSTPLDRSRYLCMHFIFLFFCIFFPFVSIASCFSFSCRFMVLCSLVPSMSVFCLSPVKSFGFLCLLTIVSKRGEKFENWMSFLRGSNRLRGRISC